jgi:hypothetical protein
MPRGGARAAGKVSMGIVSNARWRRKSDPPTPRPALPAPLEKSPAEMELIDLLVGLYQCNVNQRVAALEQAAPLGVMVGGQRP